jgi:vanillate/3-O-methylgallate O-demethylase
MGTLRGASGSRMRESAVSDAADSGSPSLPLEQRQRIGPEHRQTTLGIRRGARYGATALSERRIIRRCLRHLSQLISLLRQTGSWPDGRRQDGPDHGSIGGIAAIAMRAGGPAKLCEEEGTSMARFSVDGMRTPPQVYAWSRFGEPEYTTWLDEELSWKETCYIGDWSFLWQHHFRGPDVLRLFSDITVNTYKSFAIGQSKHAVHTNRDGKVIHEGILTRYSEDDFVLHGRGGFWARYCAERGDYNLTVERDDWFIYQVSGPNAIKVLRKLDSSDELLETKFMWVTPLTIAGKKVWALRQGMSGEVGFELQGPAEYGKEVYAAVLEAGQELGIRRMGARVALINHLEAAYPTIATDYIPAIFGADMAEYLDVFLSSMPSFAQPAYIAGSYPGREISEYYRSPIELGWARTVSLDHDFLGRDALAAEKAAPRRVLRTLEWGGGDVADVYASLFREGPNYTYMEMPRDQRGFMWADRVTRDGRDIGVTTSRGYSYYYRRMLSLATIDAGQAEVGGTAEIVWGNPGDPEKIIRARIAPAPYKPDHARGDLHAAV